MIDRRKMLIVDDSWEDRTILKEIFKDDFIITEADDGMNALAELYKNMQSYSVVLLDIVMPGMNGYEVLKQMRERGMLHDLPVVVISSLDVTDDEVMALDYGAWDFITKPFEVKLVTRRVLNVISRNEVKKITVENARLEAETKNAEIMRYKAEHDELTDMYNSQKFANRVVWLLGINPEVKYDIIRIDISGFKVFNDQFGFAVGDALIKFVSSIIRTVFEDDSVYARIYADQFVVCCRQESIDYDDMVERFTRATNELDMDFNIILCFGIYHINGGKVPVKIMCDRALLALNTIKGNCVHSYAVYDSILRQKILAEQSIVNDMNEALENGEFEIFFQPQYNHCNGKITGAEVLSRWKHHDRGYIMPEEYIGIFEKNGFILKHDEYIWRKACEWLSSWITNENKDFQIAISVNVSRIDIFNERVYTVLTGLIEEFNLPVSLFRIEITESAYIENAELLIETVIKLRSYGFLIEMDDFGSGFSSLNILKDVPVDVLKLDMEFLSDENYTGRGKNILMSVIRMAKLIDLPVIAEGVETRQQADFLKSIGCYSIQGYYYSKPLSVTAFEDLLKSQPLTSNVLTQQSFIKDSEEDKYLMDAQMALIFNSYIGAAGLFEYDGRDIEALRINDQCFDELGIKRYNYTLYNLNIFEHIDQCDRQTFIDLIEASVNDDNITEGVTRWHRESPDDKGIWLKIRMKCIAKHNGNHVIFAIIDNITSCIMANKEE